MFTGQSFFRWTTSQLPLGYYYHQSHQHYLGRCTELFYFRRSSRCLQISWKNLTGLCLVQRYLHFVQGTFSTLGKTKHFVAFSIVNLLYLNQEKHNKTFFWKNSTGQLSNLLFDANPGEHSWQSIFLNLFSFFNIQDMENPSIKLSWCLHDKDRGYVIGSEHQNVPAKP